MVRIHSFSVAALLLAAGGSSGFAAPVYWTDWESSTSDGGFTGNGTITTGGSTVSVIYNNPQGISFF